MPSVNDLAEEIDLAIITTPAETILSIINQCIDKKIKSIVIISAGFSEKGKEGRLLEQSILAVARESNIRIIGR